MSEEVKKARRKPDDPLVYVPGGARLHFDTQKQTPPSTKYNSWTFILDDETLRKVTGGYGRDGDSGKS